MKQSLRWTVADLEVMPDPLEDTRYEIIDGEFYVLHQPSWVRQAACAPIVVALHRWNAQVEVYRRVQAQLHPWSQAGAPPPPPPFHGEGEGVVPSPRAGEGQGGGRDHAHSN